MIQGRYTIFTTSATDSTVYVTGTSAVAFLVAAKITNESAGTTPQKVRLWNVASGSSSTGNPLFEAFVASKTTDVYNPQDVGYAPAFPGMVVSPDPPGQHRSGYIFPSNVIMQFDQTGTVAIELVMDEEKL